GAKAEFRIFKTPTAKFFIEAVEPFIRGAADQHEAAGKAEHHRQIASAIVKWIMYRTVLCAGAPAMNRFRKRSAVVEERKPSVLSARKEGAVAAPINQLRKNHVHASP